jgi:hypothetical protein
MTRIFLISVFLLQSTLAGAVNVPPVNSFLANSSYSMAHGNPSQQDSVAQPGPSGPTRTLQPDQIQYQHVGPAHFGAATSGVYPDGKRVFWSNGIDRIVKIDYDSWEVVAEYFFPDAEVYDEQRAEQSIADFDASNSGFFALVRAFREMAKLRDLANLYTVLDKDHTYYVGSKTGLITAYGDADPDDSRSAIIKKAEFQLPPEMTGPVMGLNMTYDGWLIVATEHGYIAAVKTDFSEVHTVRMRHSEGAEDKATGVAGKGWIRNGFAIDDRGGIYIASQDHMHKVIWTGDRLSIDETDGAWTARYLNGGGQGTGATPSLMGFGDEDRFVVITDGEDLMNVVLFWRDAIPEGWQPPEGAPDRRIAGMLPANMGDPELAALQSEQSVIVQGYGALVVNNTPRNIPWYLPERARALLISLLGSNPDYQPYGVQKFQWNPRTRRLENSWVNTEVSSPSTVPMASLGSNRVYLIGARDNQWTLEALDWDTGKSDFHYVIGGQRYNVMFSGTLLDEDGRVHYGTPWGRVRLNVPAEDLSGSRRDAVSED